MKPQVTAEKRRGITMPEVVVLTLVLAVAVSMLLPIAGRHTCCKATRISCVNNLKQIGTAYRIWENDNGSLYPTQQSETLGGMKELLAGSFTAGQYAYLPYAIMQNEMGQSPKVMVCPSDGRIPGANFFPGANAPKSTNAFKLGGTGTFDNTNVSYFCGIGASDTYPQSLLGGDRNLGDGGYANSPMQDPYYGISGSVANPSPNSGADAIVNTNGNWVFAAINVNGGRADRRQAVAWSAKMHSAGKPAGAGNILLGDGSAQQCNSAGFRSTWLKNAIDTGNFAAIDRAHSTNRGDIRLLFP